MLIFLTLPWVGLQCVNVAFPDHTHLLFYCRKKYAMLNIKHICIYFKSSGIIFLILLGARKPDFVACEH